jgi:ribose transport system ATP-binding protein
MSYPALSIRNLSKTFSGTRVLHDVDLEVAPGEVRGIVGQNGSGKSTLIKVLAGFYTPDTGAQISVAGVPLPADDSASADTRGLRFVHQDLGLVLMLDATDNLALGPGYETGRLGLIKWGAAHRATREALRALGYDIDTRCPLSKMDIAQRTAIAIARALSTRSAEPRVLVLDEPTANLPAVEADRLFRLVRGVRDSGVAVVFVSHHLHEVFDLCDSVTVLRDGRHIVTRPTVSLTEAELVSLMIGRELQRHDVHPEAVGEKGDVTLEVSELATSNLRKVSFSVRAGEVVGIAGITGSGREEVAGALFGGIERHGGEIRIDGSALRPGRPDLAMAAGMALVPAERHQNAAFLHQNVRENIAIGDLAASTGRVLLSHRRETSDIATWLERLTVSPRQTEGLMSTLSGGNQQKVVLARWLRRNPRLLILDEPTQGVDVGAKAEIHALVDRLAESGASVVVASTDNDELTRLCDRVIVLNSGMVARELRRPAISSDSLTAVSLRAGNG